MKTIPEIALDLRIADSTLRRRIKKLGIEPVEKQWRGNMKVGLYSKNQQLFLEKDFNKKPVGIQGRGSQKKSVDTSSTKFKHKAPGRGEND
jgi:hypothetical protein